MNSFEDKHRLLPLTVGEYHLDGRIDLALHLLIGGLLLICTIGKHETFGVISLGLMAIYYAYLLIGNLKFVLKYLFFVFGIAINVLGVAACEFVPLWLNELQSGTQYVGALPLLVFARWLFLAVLMLLESSRFSAIPTQRKEYSQNTRVKWIPIATLATMAILLVALLDVVRYPPAFAAGIDRFSWGATYTNRLLPNAVLSNMIYLLFIPVMSIRYGNRRLGIAAIAVYLIYSFWTGVKFGGYFELLCIFVWVYYDVIFTANVRKLQTVAVGLFAGILILVGGAAYLNSLSASTETTATNYLFSRMAQQGQLWWKTYEQSDALHIADFENEISAITHGDPTEEENHVGSKQGLYMIMYYTAPANIINSKLASGSSYTEAGYASMYYYFGSLGVAFFSLIMAGIIWLCVTYFLRALSSAKIIDAVVILRITFVAASFLSMFWLGLFKPVSIVCYLYLIFAYLFRHEERNKSISNARAPLVTHYHEVRGSPTNKRSSLRRFNT